MRAILILAMLLVASPLGAYDRNKPEAPELFHNGIFTYVRIQVIGTAMGMVYDDGWKKRETVFHQAGSGCVVKDGYILTAAHVLIPDKVMTPSSRYVTHQSEPIKVINRMILIYNFSNTPMLAKIHYINEVLDTAILKYEPIGVLEPLNYDIEYCQNEILKGDVVFSYLHKRNKDGSMSYELEPRYGFVLSREPTLPDNGSTAWFNPYDITLYMNIQPGDSGSPLFAFRDGKPVLIGIIRAMYDNGDETRAYAVTLPSAWHFMEVN